jgi:hypothetical protein
LGFAERSIRRSWFGTDTRLAGTRCRNPRRGRGSLRRISRPSAIDTPRGRPGSVLAPSSAKPAGGGPRLERGRRGGRGPLEGTKTQGRLESDRSFGRLRTTDFRGGQRPEGRRGSARLGSAGPFESTPSGLGRPRGSTRAAEGETFEGKIPRALPSETWREVSGGTKRQEGTNPEGAA